MTYKLLPSEEGLDIQALSRLFDDTTNSYKLLFFRSILQIIGQDSIRGDRSITLSDIVIKMLVNAWQISEFYKLSLGTRDGIASVLSCLKVDFFGVSLTSAAFNKHLESEIDRAYKRNNLGQFLRYVPYRLLRPFFADKIKGLPDHKVNKAIQDCAAKASYSDFPPLYTIHESGDCYISVNDRWLRYIISNFRILTDWTDWHLANYLQERNPNSPSIIKKLSLPRVRKSLMPFKKIWTPLLKAKVLNASTQVSRFMQIASSLITFCHGRSFVMMSHGILFRSPERLIHLKEVVFPRKSIFLRLLINIPGCLKYIDFTRRIRSGKRYPFLIQLRFEFLRKICSTLRHCLGRTKKLCSL